MTEVRKRPTVAIVGAGAAGTLTAVQLCETATRRRTPLDLVLIDPAPEAGRGTAYATPDPRHRLNVPADGMSPMARVPDTDPGPRRESCRPAASPGRRGARVLGVASLEPAGAPAAYWIGGCRRD